MAVDRALSSLAPGPDDPGQSVEMPPEIVLPDGSPATQPTEDGGAIVSFGGDTGQLEPAHLDNLADHMSDSDLASLASDLLDCYEADARSRKSWEEAYIKGLDLLGMKMEDRTSPWPGACGVYHPVLAEAVVKFQASSIMEIFPAGGPVKTKIMGRTTPDKEEQAIRVQDELNYLLTEVMTEYRSEMEQLLYYLPIAGAAFKKVYYDPTLQRPVGTFVPAEDFIVSYGASDLESCERYTHRMKKTKNEIRKLQVGGLYRDIDLSKPAQDFTDAEKKLDDLQGIDQPSMDKDDQYVLLEMHTDLDLKGFEDPDGIALPYIVTFDKSSQNILSIYRNWEEQDTLRGRNQYFVPYHFLPGLGFYGAGLIHTIGGLTKAATASLRQLVDSGTLSNLPGGLKMRGLRIKGDDTPIAPGEFRDVDVPGSSIRDAITFLPYKEPSAVLYQLLGQMVQEARDFASISDVPLQEMNSEAPVGTTLAIIERRMKVMSAVQARLHASLKKELKLLANIVKNFMPAKYSYEVEDPQADRAKDFGDRVEIIPVSDPNATSMAQRISQYQAALQLAAQAPQIYNIPELHRQMLLTMNIREPEKIIPPDHSEPCDPVQENMNILMGKPVKAYLYQDHESHIKVHMAAMQDPKLMAIIGQSPQASVIAAAAESHVREHVAYQYRREIEKQMGAPLPDPEMPLPQDVEYELSSVVAAASDKLLAKDQQEAAAQQAAQKQQDPLIQMQQKELQIKEAAAQAAAADDQQKNQLKLQQIETDAAIAREQIASRERIEGTKIGVDISKHSKDNSTRRYAVDQKPKPQGNG